MSRILALKVDGTHPPAEGFLASFAEVRSISPPFDLDSLARARADIFICDIALPLKGFDTQAFLKKLMQLGENESTPVIMITADFRLSPTRLKNQLSRLGALKRSSPGRLTVPQIVELMDISQETLGRILNVSVRTANRWIKGAKPRPKQELVQLERVLAVLRETFTSRDAIRSYLHHPNPALNGETPIGLLVRGEFTSIIEDLMALREGAFE